jgi:predicted dehydrogenase
VTGSSIGVAVVGAGMAGRSHAAGYRTAPTLYDEGLPEVRLVAIADVNQAFAADTARRYGYERAETDWRALAEAPDVDVVSVVVANFLHREIVEGLLAAGKHVLCEKPMAPTTEDAEAMVAAAEASGRETGVGFVFRRSPAIAAIRDQVASGTIGRPLHFNGHYWCDYAVDPRAPMSRGPRRRRAQRQDRAGRERGPGQLHGQLRLRRHRHPVGLPGRLRAGQLPRLRGVHRAGRGHL